MAKMSDGEKLFLAVVAFLLLKGLLDPKDAKDRKRVNRVWDRYRKGGPDAEKLPLFEGTETTGG